MHPVSIETPRLLLREFEEADHVAVNVFQADPDVVRYQSADVFSLEESRAYVQKLCEESHAIPRRAFELAMIARGDQMLIGRCGIAIRRPQHGEAEIFYVVRRDRWGRGYAAEAVQALVDFGFAQLGLHRIYADADPRNIGSLRVAEKAGMQREGLLRENWRLKNEWCSSVIFGILEHEWRARRT